VQGGGTKSAMVRYSVGIGTTLGSITLSKIGAVPAVTGALRVAAAAIQADPSMIRTNTGLIYQELVKGTGRGYSSSSTGVRVNYKGYTSEGDLFDSGTNSSFSLAGVISGFSEGLKRMKEGGTAKLIIAADLAYGNAAPSNGKPITFIVDLLAFTP
jgi:FKBP-type peptidyl-prolyl cis-trans isomerase